MAKRSLGSSSDDHLDQYQTDVYTAREYLRSAIRKARRGSCHDAMHAAMVAYASAEKAHRELVHATRNMAPAERKHFPGGKVLPRRVLDVWESIARGCVLKSRRR